MIFLDYHVVEKRGLQVSSMFTAGREDCNLACAKSLLRASELVKPFPTGYLILTTVLQGTGHYPNVLNRIFNCGRIHITKFALLTIFRCIAALWH